MVASRTNISTNASNVRCSVKKSKHQVAFNTALAMNRSVTRRNLFFIVLSVKKAIILDFVAPLFQKIKAEIVARIKIVVHATGNAQDGGVRAGVISSFLYQSMPRFVKMEPKVAVAIVTSGITM